MNKQEFERLQRLNGWVGYKNEILALMSQAYWSETVNALGGKRGVYVAMAMNEEGEDYHVQWEITNDDCDAEEFACDWTKYTVRKI